MLAVTMAKCSVGLIACMQLLVLASGASRPHLEIPLLPRNLIPV